jgi:3-hydroxyisobutyrate dehydrogenase-like beta-hydroxyacid dehydrogenase
LGEARRIGILHPGEMGRVAAATLVHSGNEVYWASDGRSANTKQRAASLNLVDTLTIAELCRRCEAIVSVCPPEFADQLADEVLTTGFRGLYVDANAISPDRALKMAARMRTRGVTFVDGGIIGLASMTPGKTWLYLSGDAAPEIAKLFSEGPMQPEVLAGPAGRASALKMCFAAYSKITTALLTAILAAADHQGVRAELEQQWSRMPGSLTDAVEKIPLSAPKAWRFVPEMQEIAATFESSGVSPAFPKAAAEIYSQLALFRNAKPDLEAILSVLSPVLAPETK